MPTIDNRVTVTYENYDRWQDTAAREIKKAIRSIIKLACSKIKNVKERGVLPAAAGRLYTTHTIEFYTHQIVR